MVMLGYPEAVTALHPSSYCQHAQRSSGYWPPGSCSAVRSAHDHVLLNRATSKFSNGD